MNGCCLISPYPTELKICSVPGRRHEPTTAPMIDNVETQAIDIMAQEVASSPIASTSPSLPTAVLRKKYQGVSPAVPSSFEATETRKETENTAGLPTEHHDEQSLKQDQAGP